MSLLSFQILLDNITEFIIALKSNFADHDISNVQMTKTIVVGAILLVFFFSLAYFVIAHHGDYVCGNSNGEKVFWEYD